MSNPKADLHNINAHIKFRENPLRFTRYCFESKIRMYCGQITVKNGGICLLAMPKQMSTKSMHTPSLVKIHWHSLVIVWKWKYRWMDVRKTNGHTDSQHDTIIIPATIVWQGINKWGRGWVGGYKHQNDICCSCVNDILRVNIIHFVSMWLWLDPEEKLQSLKDGFVFKQPLSKPKQLYIRE